MVDSLKYLHSYFMAKDKKNRHTSSLNDQRNPKEVTVNLKVWTC
jgi:hypothetical protein